MSLRCSNDVLTAVAAASLRALRPPPRISLSAWIEANVQLPQGLAATPGPMKLWPYQAEMADAIGDPGIERVSILKAARIGYTSLLNAAIASWVVNDPSAILLVLPTESDCRDAMVSDIEPLFSSSPVLCDKLRPPTRTPDERSTILHRLYPGGSLKVVPARSPRSLRRHTAKILLCDEIDAMEVTDEGDPVTLAERRTLSFRDRKIVCGSTPTEESTSAILRLYERSDQRVFEVPCPRCGGFTEILWRHIEWEPDKPETAAFRCPHCQALIPEQDKPQMIINGRWCAQQPEVINHAGFRLSALASLLANAAWRKLAAEFLAAQHDKDRLKVFSNTTLAEPWRGDDDSGLDEGELVRLVEDISLEKIPPEVLQLTCGVDVQGDRFEATVMGFDRAGTAYVLEHAVIYGKPLDPNDEVWRDLDDHLRRRFKHPKGGTIRIDSAVVDCSDGDSYAQVLAFCAPRYGRKVLAGRGAAGMSRPPLTLSKSRRGRFFIIGVDSLKSRILSMLASPAKLIRFTAAVANTDYFTQMTSERKVVRMSRGRPVVRFERRQGTRNEAIDCAVYALAAKAALSVNLDRREAELASEAPPVPKPPQVYRSQFVDRLLGR